MLGLYNYAEDKSLGHHFHNKQQTCSIGNSQQENEAHTPPSGHARAGLTPKVLFSQSQQWCLSQSNYAVSQDHCEGESDTDSTSHEAISKGMCVALVREQRFGRCCFILAFRSGICTYSLQTTFLENIWTFLSMTAPCEGSEMAVKFISLGNSWFADWRTGFLVYRHNHKAASCVRNPHNYTVALGERPDKFYMDLFQRGKCFL